MTLAWNRETISPQAIRFCPSPVLPVSGVLERWRGDPAFVDGFVETLAEVPFRAFLWETPPVNEDTMDRSFEFTVTDCPALDRRPDVSPFRNQIEAADEAGVARFPNLSGDATLIVPRPGPDRHDFAHLGAFARTAAIDLQRGLWRAVADALDAQIGPHPVWLSTSGLGVAWLHVRIDDSPKYYAHSPYKHFP